MPELPEVEYTARQLRATIVGTSIQEVHVFWERTIRYVNGDPGLHNFCAEIVGRRIEAVRRRGKFLLLDLNGGLFLSIHRRMTGNFLLLPPGWLIDTSLRETDPATWKTRGPTFLPQAPCNTAYSHEAAYCRVCFDLQDGRRLLYTDPRKFGRIELWPHEREDEALKGLGPEPLGEEFTVEHFAVELSKRKSGIKQVLLDQSVVAGVGN